MIGKSLSRLSTSSNAEEILSSNEAPMAIRMDVISSLVTTDAMKTALNEGLEKSTGNNTGPIMKEINQLNSTSLKVKLELVTFMNSPIFQIQGFTFLKTLHISIQFLGLILRRHFLEFSYQAIQFRKV